MKNGKEENRSEILHLSKVPLFKSLPAEELLPLVERFEITSPA